MKLIHHAFALAAAAALAAPAQAIDVTGTTAGAATWARPVASGNAPPEPPLSFVGTAVRYTSLQFTVSTAGTYNFLSTSVIPAEWDNYAFLYRNAFNPTAQFANVLIGNDDFGGAVGVAGFSLALTAGTNYFFITTGFENTDFGSYTNSITGPGSVNVVPEPASVALLALGLLGVLGAARRRSA